MKREKFKEFVSDVVPDDTITPENFVEMSNDIDEYYNKPTIPFWSFIFNLITKSKSINKIKSN